MQITKYHNIGSSFNCKMENGTICNVLWLNEQPTTLK